MINLKKITHNATSILLREVSESEQVSEASEMFASKSFRERYAGSKSFAVVVGYIAQGVSGVLASSFFYFRVALPALPFGIVYLDMVLATLLTLIALVILEWLKRTILVALSTSYYKSKAGTEKMKTFLIPVACLLTVISIYTSFEGAKVYVSKKDASSMIQTKYDSLLQAVSQEESQFKNSISWKGKIDTYNKANAKILTGFQDKKTMLEQEKSKEIGHHQSDIGDKGYSVAIFSLLMEIVGIACMCFVVYCNYYIYIESKIATKQEVEEPQPKLRTLYPNRNDTSNHGNNPINKVGFTLGINTAKIVDDNRVSEGNRICKHCNQSYIYKHHKQVYCTNECRNEAWEQRTGKKLNFKKGEKQI